MFMIRTLEPSAAARQSRSRTPVAAGRPRERLGRAPASGRRGGADAVCDPHGAHRRRARLWRRAAPPAARHHAQPDHGGAGRHRARHRLPELDRGDAAGRLLRGGRHRQRHGRPACRARRRDRFGAGREAAVLRPQPAGADRAGRGNDDVPRHRAAQLAAIRPHPRRHRPAGAVAATDRPGVRAAARRASCCRSSSPISPAIRSPPTCWPRSSPGCSIRASRRCCCWWRSPGAASFRRSSASCWCSASISAARSLRRCSPAAPSRASASCRSAIC